jgi:hypothetical protein
MGVAEKIISFFFSLGQYQGYIHETLSGKFIPLNFPSSMLVASA